MGSFFRAKILHDVFALFTAALSVAKVYPGAPSLSKTFIRNEKHSKPTSFLNKEYTAYSI